MGPDAGASLDAAAVMSAALAWSYAPAGTPEVRTEEFLLVARPTTWVNPTIVNRIDSPRPSGELVGAVLRAAEKLGREDITFWTHSGTRPADLAEHLLARGAVLDEVLAVLARPLVDLPDLAVPGDVEVRVAIDLDTLLDLDRVSVAVFGGTLTTEDDLLATYDGDLATGVGFVAYRGASPVASAGLTIRDGAARLWGAGTLPEARHTGAYRALLAHRLLVGRDHGAAMALVKGRLETSAPILRRAGFASYGEERSYRLIVAG